MRQLPQEAKGGRLWPMTLSGSGLVVPIDDQRALEIQPGEVVMVTSPTGLKPMVITEQRWGVTECSEGMPVEVPVFEGQVYGGPIRPYATTDCYQVEIIQL